MVKVYSKYIIARKVMLYKILHKFYITDLLFYFQMSQNACLVSKVKKKKVCNFSLLPILLYNMPTKLTSHGKTEKSI